MANFAELDESRIVSRVLVVGNEVTTIDGVEVEQRGIDFLNDIFPESGTWVQTSMWTRGGVHNGVDGEPDGGNRPEKLDGGEDGDDETLIPYDL